MGAKHMETIEGVRIQRRTIPSYATADFWEAMGMWSDWKAFGFPEAGGTQDQPALWLDVVKLIESMSKREDGRRVKA